MSNASKILKFQAEMVPVIAELRNQKKTYIHDLMDRAHEATKDRAWWNNGQGYFDLVGGVASGAIGIAGGFMPENISKILDGVSKAVPFLANVGKTRMESEKMELQLTEGLLTGTEIPTQTSDERAEADFERELFQATNRNLDAIHQGKSRAASERG